MSKRNEEINPVNSHGGAAEVSGIFAAFSLLLVALVGATLSLNGVSMAGVEAHSISMAGPIGFFVAAPVTWGIQWGRAARRPARWTLHDYDLAVR